MSDEESKAVQEVAKATGQTVEAVRDLGGFIAKHVDATLEQVMGIFNDKLKYRRWENQVLLAEKAKAFLAARGLNGPTRLIGMSLAIPLLEEASMVELDALQDRWAALLANAADKDQPEVRRAYVTILAELTPFDALVLGKIFDADRAFLPTKEMPVAALWTHYLPEEVMVSGTKEIQRRELATDVDVSLTNLSRLGLIAGAGAFDSGMSWVSMTALGREFVMACSPIAIQ